MSEFKPMVKMNTDEPSVILKLKKGGHVNAKEEGREEHGHKPMREACDEHFAAGGRAPGKPSAAERRRAMNPNFKRGGDVRNERHEERRVEHERKDKGQELKRVERELKHHEREPAHLGHEGLRRGGKMHKADGGSITASMTRTTVRDNAGRFVSDISSAEHGSKAKRGTGDVQYGGKAGYKSGGGVKGLATMETAEHGSKAKRGTGDVKLGNGGYKKGGKVEHKAKGGEPGVGRAIEGNEDKFTNGNITDGDRTDNAKGTGDVRFGNAGGYRKGGHVRGKAYATGGTIDDGRAVKMPRKPVSQPVANSLQSGTFKHGGKIAKLAVGGLPPGTPAVPASAASDPESQMILDDIAAMKQQEMNNAGYDAATRQVPTPGILQRMRNGLGFKRGGKAE